MTFNEFKQLVIAECEKLGISEYELYYQAGESTSVDTFQHSINEFTSSYSGGLCFRAIVNGKMGYASTEDLSAQQAKAVVLKAMDSASVLESEEQVFLGEGGQEYEPLEDRSYPLPTTEELIAKVLETTEKLYAADPMAVDGCQTQGIIETSEMAIYNSKGLDLQHKSSAAGLVAVGVVSNGQEMSNDYQIKLGELSKIDVDQLVAKAVGGAKEKLGGEVAPTGQYPVIFNTEAMTSLLGVYSGIFNSESAQKGLSKLAGKEGEVIAAACVNLIDDPFHKDNPEPMNFDAEGSPTHKKAVIENGVLNTLLYNLKTAAVAGKKTTGNASKAGYDASVAVRPFTMYLAAGDMTEEALKVYPANTDEEAWHANGDSFRDLTRIAKINDRMWSELFLMNKEALLSEMDKFIEEFTEFRSYLADEDGKRMREKMRASSARRSLFDKPVK